MDMIKDAFNKVKEDIDSLRKEIVLINSEIKSLKEELIGILGTKNSSNSSETIPADQHIIPADQHIIPADQHIIPADNSLFKPQKPQYLGISNGNEGVPTDRQTNQQTNQQIQNTPLFEGDSMENALKILSSLDSIKKEVRLKFKELTEQEFRVFSMIYQLDEERGFSDYRSLSKRLDITESSVRDYIGKLIKKGIPVDKIKINNKNIHLSISPNLKKVATLNTILQLRGI